MNKFLMKLDIQKFSDGEGGSEGNPNQGQQTGGIKQRGNSFDYTEPTEVPEYQGGIEPLPWEHQPRDSVVNDESHTPDRPQEQQPNQEQPNRSEEPPTQELPEFDFGGRKVRPDDPDSIKGAYQDFVQAQRTITQLQQQTQQYEQFLQNLNSMGALPNQQGQQGQQGQPTQQEQPPQAPSKERMQELHDEYMNRMYENKFEADQWWAQQPEVQSWEQQRYQQYVKPIIEPIQQERENNQKIQQMKQQYGDFDQYVPKMQEILDQRPELNSVDQVESVYWIAKAQALENQPRPEEMLKDPNFQQQILQDEGIRNQILQSYQSQKQQQRRQAPPMAGNRPGGQTPTFGYKPPKSIREAGKLVRQKYNFY